MIEGQKFAVKLTPKNEGLSSVTSIDSNHQILHNPGPSMEEYMMTVTPPNAVLAASIVYCAGMAAKNTVKVLGMEKSLSNLIGKLTGSPAFNFEKGDFSNKPSRSEKNRVYEFKAESPTAQKVFGKEPYRISQQRVEQCASAAKIVLYAGLGVGYYQAIQ